MVILCDVDGVVADLHSVWLQRYNERWDDNLKVEDIKGWNFHLYVKRECGKQVYDILHEKDLYLDVPDVVGAIWGVKALRRAGHRVVFVSSCVDGSIDQKVEWLRRHGLLDSKYVAGPDFVAANDKSMVQGDVLIDDAPHNLMGTSAYPILFDAHHNQDAGQFLRVKNWDEVVELMKCLMTTVDKARQPSPADLRCYPPVRMSDMRRPGKCEGLVGTVTAEGGLGGIVGDAWNDNPPVLDEERVISATGGQKGTKLARFDLIPAGPLREVAEHYGKGAQKYDDRNWERGYDWSLSFAALMRHAWAWWNGEDTDAENGSHHMAAVVFHALALLEFRRTHPGYDNRPVVVNGGTVLDNPSQKEAS